MLRWRVGAVTITRILEIEGFGEVTDIFPEGSPEKLKRVSWLCPDFADEKGRFKGSSHALIIETPSRRIVVDTCWGNDKQALPAMFRPFQRLKTSFLDDFEKAGFDRRSIDTVLCTHLHVDHIGWNTMLIDGDWVPTFPNARYLIGRGEYEHWLREGAEWVVLSESIAPILDAGVVDFVEPNHLLCEEVRLVPTPGHTPHHVSVLITSRGENAIITGDFIHHPAQMAYPEWWTPFDSDRAQAIATRRKMLGELSGSPTLMIGTHFPSPTGGYVVPEGQSYRLANPRGKTR